MHTSVILALDGALHWGLPRPRLFVVTISSLEGAPISLLSQILLWDVPELGEDLKTVTPTYSSISEAKTLYPPSFSYSIIFTVPGLWVGMVWAVL